MLLLRIKRISHWSLIEKLSKDLRILLSDLLEGESDIHSATGARTFCVLPSRPVLP